MTPNQIREKYLAEIAKGKSHDEATEAANQLAFRAVQPKSNLPALSDELKGKLTNTLELKNGPIKVVDPTADEKGKEVEIPDDWESMKWMQQEKLAKLIIGQEKGPLVTSDGQSRADKAKAIIKGELAGRVAA